MTIRTLEQQHRPICGLHAIALATPDKTVDDVERFYKPKKGRSWKGRLYWIELVEGLKAFGVQHKELEVCSRKTAKTTVEQLESGKQYLVFVTGHFFTYKDGLLWDQYYNSGKPLTESKWARKRVRRVVQIERSEA